MASSAAATPDEYLASLPNDRRAALATVRAVVRENLPPGFEEGIAHGMIVWYVPLERFPDTYNREPLMLAGLANQKRHMSLYLNSVYGDPATERWFRERWAESGLKLDMGKSCMRFRRLDDLPLEVVGEAIGRTDLETYLDRYREVRGSSRETRAPRGVGERSPLG